MSETISIANKVIQVFQFEHWLRFYFIQEKNNKLKFDFDQNFLNQLKNCYGDLVEIAENLNHKNLTPELSQQIIVEFLQKHFEKIEGREVVAPILDSKNFFREMQLFNVWLNLFENQLEEKILPFEVWISLFQKWKESDQGKKILYSLKMEKINKPTSKKLN
ncbi:MAG: hypothetical protein Q9M37_04435 [Desulfonauticus sp.]|nr:hypothetical protein [Desulfonauticus sp.]